MPGIEERWGRDVLHCPYCHGWEVRDRAIGVLGTGPLAVHQALLWRQWSPAVTLFLHTAPAPGPEEYEQLAARDIIVVEGQVAGLETRDDRLAGVRLDGGRTVTCEALAITPRFTARAEPLAGLGVRTAEQEMNGHVVGTHVPADRSGATEVPGVWVAGNVADLAEQVIGAAAAGVRAGAAINADLIAEETRRAVSTRRAATTQATAHGGHAGHSGTAGQDGAGEEFWDARYRESERIWSGEPNAALVREVADLEPGTALDLGCGEGADAIWLARRGWKVTAVDISGVALERAARYAVAEGVEGIDWQRHDLGSSWPEGEYDLVSAHFLHSPGDMPRESILRRAAAAVAPAGFCSSWGTRDSRRGNTTIPTSPCPLRRRSSTGSAFTGTSGRWSAARSTSAPRPAPTDGRRSVRTARSGCGV